MDDAVERFKEKNILILTSQYPDSENKMLGDPFVKSQVDGIKNYFNKIIVISPIPYFPKALKNISVMPVSFRNYSRYKDYTYENVSVYYPKFLTLPFVYFKKRNGKRAYSSVLKCIDREKLEFDLIHAHFAWMSGYIGKQLKDIYKIPLFVTVHGSTVRIALNPKLQPPTFKGQDVFLKRNLDYVLQSADAIITNHPELYELIIYNYDSKTLDKLHLLDKEVDADLFNPYKKSHKEHAEKLKKDYRIENTFNVLFLATITQHKDPKTFVDVAQKMKEHTDIRFIMVGDGDLLNEIVDMKKEKNITNLIIIGSQKLSPDWYIASDIFCSLNDVENIWLGTIQEALCVGTPIIVTNTPYVTKYLQQNIDAYIIPIGDSNALVSAILKLKNDSNLLKNLSKKKDEWRLRFDSKKIVKDIMNIYENIMNKKGLSD